MERWLGTLLGERQRRPHQHPQGLAPIVCEVTQLSSLPLTPRREKESAARAGDSQVPLLKELVIFLLVSRVLK